MKKLITMILTSLLLICLSPISVSAEEALKAPTVQYKLINHDEIALRWTEVECADGYCVYRTDVETGKTVKYKEIVTDTTFNATGLEQATDYVFKVAAVSEKEGQITIGKKSTGTALTTPDEWYYYFESSEDSYFDPYSDDLNGTVMKRRHYDNSGTEDFDMSHINSEAKKKAIDDLIYDDWVKYSRYDFRYINGYVYFNFEYATSSEDAVQYICRMKNDGSDFEIIGRTWCYVDYKIFVDPEKNKEYVYATGNYNHSLWELEDEDYEIIKDFNYFKEDYNDIYDDLSEYQRNTGYDIRSLYYCVHFCESDIEMFYYDKDKKINEKKLYSEERTALSGPVGDDEYIYFLSEPLYGITDKTDTVIYRSKYDGTDLQKIITLPKDNSFIYGSMELFDCDGEYLYYYVYGKKASEINRNLYYTFYRININEKSAVPQKIISVDDLSLPYNRSVELCNGYLYIKTYIYDKNYNEVPIYICIRADGKGLKKQNEPFEWRY